jgi:hypothetical protein
VPELDKYRARFTSKRFIMLPIAERVTHSPAGRGNALGSGHKTGFPPTSLPNWHVDDLPTTAAILTTGACFTQNTAQPAEKTHTKASETNISQARYWRTGARPVTLGAGPFVTKSLADLKGKFTINVRAESVTFAWWSPSFKKRRCFVPTSGFTNGPQNDVVHSCQTVRRVRRT